MGVGVRVGLVLFFLHVLGIIFVNLFFAACLKTEFCSLCTSMFAFGTIMIW